MFGQKEDGRMEKKEEKLEIKRYNDILYSGRREEGEQSTKERRKDQKYK